MGRDYGQDCPLAKTAEIVAERWTPLILRQLFEGHCRFTQIAEDLPGISPRILSARLRRLEAHGVIERRVHQACPTRAEYHLTESGRALRMLALAMTEWGAQHCRDAGPTRLNHAGCGGSAHLEVRCDACERALDPGEVALGGGGQRSR